VKSLEHLLAAQNKLVPEMVDLLQDRYRMLKYVKMVGPIGRRTLGEMAGLSERETRTMIDLLRTQKLLDINRSGASITTEGIDVLETLESTMEKWSGLTTIAKRLAERLGIQSVKIVAGNADTNAAAKSFLRTTIRRFEESITTDSETAALALKKATRALDKASSKGLIHKNLAARKKSRLTSRFTNHFSQVG